MGAAFLLVHFVSCTFNYVKSKRFYTLSMIIAMPCPTPMHMVHSA